jgi:hypothetical protein
MATKITINDLLIDAAKAALSKTSSIDESVSIHPGVSDVSTHGTV